MRGGSRYSYKALKGADTKSERPGGVEPRQDNSLEARVPSRA
jgi:hypothetical protein